MEKLKYIRNDFAISNLYCLNSDTEPFLVPYSFSLKYFVVETFISISNIFNFGCKVNINNYFKIIFSFMKQFIYREMM